MCGQVSGKYLAGASIRWKTGYKGEESIAHLTTLNIFLFDQIKISWLWFVLASVEIELFSTVLYYLPSLSLLQIGPTLIYTQHIKSILIWNLSGLV